MPKFKGIPIVVAPLVAAGHKCNMPVEDLSVFINKFREIDDVTSRLAIREITAEKIDEITKAFQSGCTYSKEVIPQIFQKSDVAKKYHEIMFPDQSA